MVSESVRGHHAGRGEPHARGGLPFHGGHDRQGPRLDRTAEGTGPRPAVLRVLRPGRHPRAPPRSAGVGRQVPGPLRCGLGRTARGNLRPAKGTRGDPGGLPADRAARRNPGVGRHAGGPQTRAMPADGGLRGLSGIHRPPRRPARRRPAEPRCARRHAGVLHHRRQRRLGRGHDQRHLQRDVELQRPGRHRDAAVHDRPARQVRRAGVLQPLFGGLGACDGYPLSVDQTSGLALGWHA